jgi:hypothetical protein
VYQIDFADSTEGGKQSRRVHTSPDAAPSAQLTQIVHRRAEQPVGGRAELMMQREHMNVMARGQSLDERQNRGDDATSATAIDATSHHERHTHWRSL